MSRSIPLVVVVMLASSIGAAPAGFRMAHAALMRFLPPADEERVLVRSGRDQARGQSLIEVGLSDVDAWRRGVSRFESIEVFGSLNWTQARIKVGTNSSGAEEEPVPAGLFEPLGAWRCRKGRLLAPLHDLPRGNTLAPSGIKVRNALAAVQLTAALFRLKDARFMTRLREAI